MYAYFSDLVQTIDDLLNPNLLTTTNMSNLDAVTKVADQIISRVFDQRQFTSGEISYLTRELGLGLDLERNFDRILKLNENACVILDTSTGDMCSSYDSKREEICDKVTSLIERANNILKIETDYRERDELILGARRKEMEQKRQTCLTKCNSKLEKLRESIMKEEMELERRYLKFEENLRNK